MRIAIVEEARRLVLKEVHVPELEAGQVLIRVESTAICGSDLHAFQGEHPQRVPPVVLGHEFAGSVDRLGSGTTSLAVGDRVTVIPLSACGACPTCRGGATHVCPERSLMGSQKWPGSFAQYVVAPESLVFQLPAQTSVEVGALIEPLTVAIHAVGRAGTGLGDRVLVLGSGAIGLMVALAARAAGASTVIATDIREFNLGKAREMGATHVAHGEAEDVVGLVRDLTHGRGVDQVLVAADGEGVLDQALRSVRIRGTVVLIAAFGHPVAARLGASRIGEHTILGSAGYHEREFQAALNLASSHRAELSGLITHHFSLDDISAAFDLAERRSEDMVRVILHPWR